MLSTTFKAVKKQSIRYKNEPLFSDVNLYVVSRTKQEMVYDEICINQSVMCILGTARGTRLFRPTFGTRLDDLLFEPMTDEVAYRIKKFIELEINIWEPRLQMTYLQVDMDIPNQNYLVTIEYTIEQLGNKRVNFSFLLSQAGTKVGENA